VATWREFESGAPEMAAAAAMLWPGITTLDRGQPAPPGAPKSEKMEKEANIKRKRA